MTDPHVIERMMSDKKRQTKRDKMAWPDRTKVEPTGKKMGTRKSRREARDMVKNYFSK